MKYKVIKPCLFFFGSLNRACITLNVGQIWEGRRLSIDSKYYTISRNNVDMEITEEDLNKCFIIEREE
jgi:hypothetical protein